MSNTFLLIAQACLYFVVMTGLLEARRVIGIGVFMCAIGVMHFLETYLASVFYVAMPFGVISPGSTVLFSGKLMMLLLLYIREDAAVARQPIYGLLAGNLLLIALVMILALHHPVALSGGRLPDMAFIDEIGVLMLWGTLLLFVDAILIILLYERLGAWLGGWPGLRFLVCGIVILTLDQAGFFLALHYVAGTPWSAFWGGWVGKMSAVLIYSGLLAIYLRLFGENTSWLKRRSFSDVFQTLTYRERYHQLLETTAHDHLTGVLHRSQYDKNAPAILESSLKAGHSVTLMVIDIDHFKQINDRFGHQTGDTVLAGIAALLNTNLRSDDYLYRFGGEEFVLICDRMVPEAGLTLAERLRKTIEAKKRTHFQRRSRSASGSPARPQMGERSIKCSRLRTSAFTLPNPAAATRCAAPDRCFRWHIVGPLDVTAYDSRFLTLWP